MTRHTMIALFFWLAAAAAILMISPRTASPMAGYTISVDTLNSAEVWLHQADGWILRKPSLFKPKVGHPWKTTTTTNPSRTATTEKR